MMARRRRRGIGILDVARRLERRRSLAHTDHGSFYGDPILRLQHHLSAARTCRCALAGRSLFA
jgi:hypothetical protein